MEIRSYLLPKENSRPLYLQGIGYYSKLGKRDPLQINSALNGRDPGYPEYPHGCEAARGR